MINNTEEQYISSHPLRTDSVKKHIRSVCSLNIGVIHNDLIEYFNAIKNNKKVSQRLRPLGFEGINYENQLIPDYSLKNSSEKFDFKGTPILTHTFNPMNKSTKILGRKEDYQILFLRDNEYDLLDENYPDVVASALLHNTNFSKNYVHPAVADQFTHLDLFFQNNLNKFIGNIPINNFKRNISQSELEFEIKSIEEIIKCQDKSRRNAQAAIGDDTLYK